VIGDGLGVIGRRAEEYLVELIEMDRNCLLKFLTRDNKFHELN
jgi:hypothetical protein